jgi:hypothetical protein
MPRNPLKLHWQMASFTAFWDSITFDETISFAPLENLAPFVNSIGNGSGCLGDRWGSYGLALVALA